MMIVRVTARRMPFPGLVMLALLAATVGFLGGASESAYAAGDVKASARATETSVAEQGQTESPITVGGGEMKVQYLEIVTPDVDAACALHSKVHGVTFSDAIETLGGARTAQLSNGATLGIRAPLRDTETPVVRPYFLVDDIEAAVAAAAESGAVIAHPPLLLEGHGTFAIVIQGGIESGLWEL